MKREELNRALDHIDYDLVEEYVREKERLTRRAKIRRRFAQAARAAACLVVLVCIALPIIIFGDGAHSEQPPNSVNPPYVSTTPVGPGESLPAPEPPTGDPQPGDEDQMTPGRLAYTYSFAYNGTEYVCSFGTYDQSLEEALQTESIDPKHVGEHIGEVMVTDNNGQRGWYRLYRGDGSNLIIEIEGYYMIAQRK